MVEKMPEQDSKWTGRLKALRYLLRGKPVIANCGWEQTETIFITNCTMRVVDTFVASGGGMKGPL
jgi:hypothetical protein